MVFKNLKFYFATDERDTKEYKKLIHSLGGKVALKWTSGITHALFLGGALEDLKRCSDSNVFLVTPDWLKECYYSEMRIAEISYFSTPRKKKGNDYTIPKTQPKSKKIINSSQVKRRKTTKLVTLKNSNTNPDIIDQPKDNQKSIQKGLLLEVTSSGNINNNTSLEKEFTNTVGVTSIPLDKNYMNIKRRRNSLSKENSPKKIKITPPVLTQNISIKLRQKRKNICFSGCSSEEIEEFNNAILFLGDSEYQSYLDDTTTHLVLGANVRTLKTIVALSKGICLVRKEWIIESKKANCWLKDEDFNVNEWFPGAKYSQKAHETHPINLLFSSTTFFIGKNIAFPKNTLQRVLESLGGKVNLVPEGADIHIEGTLPAGHNHQNSTIVTESWVFDSLSNWKLLNYKNYHPITKNPF